MKIIQLFNECITRVVCKSHSTSTVAVDIRILARNSGAPNSNRHAFHILTPAGHVTICHSAIASPASETRHKQNMQKCEHLRAALLAAALQLLVAAGAQKNTRQLLQNRFLL